MLKLGAKRRRTHAEVERDKVLSQDKEGTIQKHLAAYNRVLKENEDLQANNANLHKAMDIINELEKRSIIERDQNNTYTLSDDAVNISKQKN
jgi:hypothetical protein